MIKKQPNPAPGKFLLYTKTPFGKVYYMESGTTGIGTDRQGEYIHWTKYPKHAYRFETLKRARSMADIIRSVYGSRAMIMNREGECVS